MHYYPYYLVFTSCAGTCTDEQGSEQEAERGQWASQIESCSLRGSRNVTATKRLPGAVALCYSMLCCCRPLTGATVQSSIGLCFCCSGWQGAGREALQQDHLDAGTCLLMCKRTLWWAVGTLLKAESVLRQCFWWLAPTPNHRSPARSAVHAAASP